jgi:2-methylisocitrate lyase-like PEP mutase family enzyme
MASARVKVASDGRTSADFLIIARTDSRTGLDEALRAAAMRIPAPAPTSFSSRRRRPRKKW